MGELVGEEAGPGQGMSGPSDSRSSQSLFPRRKREKEKGFQGIAGRGFFKNCREHLITAQEIFRGLAGVNQSAYRKGRAATA